MQITIDLTQIPEFQELKRQYLELSEEVRELRAATPEYVDQVEAERITGHSGTTLWRERKDPHSLIVWKRDRGIRYLRSSLLAHNNSRAVRR